jgi:hypothetical protein
MKPYNNTSPTSDPDGAVYLVLDDFGGFGPAYRETDVRAADRQATVAAESAEALVFFASTISVHHNQLHLWHDVGPCCAHCCSSSRVKGREGLM